VARGCAGVRVSSSGLRAEDEATALGGASAFGGPEPIPRWVVWVLGVLSSLMNKHNASLHSAASGADSTAGDRSFPAYDRKDTAEAPARGIFFVFALPAGIAFGVAGLVFGMRRIFRRWRYGRHSGSRWALDAAAFSPTICRASGT
jgi:hypothetical protein